MKIKDEGWKKEGRREGISTALILYIAMASHLFSFEVYMIDRKVLYLFIDRLGKKCIHENQPDGLNYIIWKKLETAAVVITVNFPLVSTKMFFLHSLLLLC